MKKIKDKDYIILNCEERGEVVFTKQVNAAILIGVVALFCAFIVVAAFFFTYDNLKDAQYREYERQLKMENKTLLR